MFSIEQIKKMNNPKRKPYVFDPDDDLNPLRHMISTLRRMYIEDAFKSAFMRNRFTDEETHILWAAADHLEEHILNDEYNEGEYESIDENWSKNNNYKYEYEGDE